MNIKNIIFFFLLIFSLSSSLVYSQENEAMTQAECETELLTKLNDLIKNDYNGILERQFELTSYKLALEVQSAGAKSIEAYVRQKSKEIKELDKDQVISKLNSLYKDNGYTEDLVKAYEHMQSRAQTANYLNGSNRFYNEETSAFILFLSLREGSALDKNDVAITWYMKKLTETNKGSTQTNTQNLSFHVTKLLGGIGSMDGRSKDEIEKLKQDTEQEIKNILSEARENIKKEMSYCYANDDDQESSCALPLETMTEGISSLLLTSNEIARKSFKFFPEDRHRFPPPPPPPPPAPKREIASTNKTSSFQGKPGEMCSKPDGHIFSLVENKSLSFDVDKFIPGKNSSVIKGLQSLFKIFPKSKSPSGVNFNLRYTQSTAKACCEKKIVDDLKEEEYAGVVSYKLKVDLYYGIPYIARIGLRAGANFEAKVGYSYVTIPSTCASGACVGIGVGIAPFLSLFGELIGIEAEAGLIWSPSATIYYCPKDSHKNYYEFHAGNIQAYYAITGWGLNREGRTDPLNKYFGLPNSYVVRKPF